MLRQFDQFVQSAHSAPVTEDLSRPNCPRCHSVLLIAEETCFEEAWFDGRGRVEHAWNCDYCGHGFVTAIRLWPR